MFAGIGSKVGNLRRYWKLYLKRIARYGMISVFLCIVVALFLGVSNTLTGVNIDFFYYIVGIVLSSLRLFILMCLGNIDRIKRVPRKRTVKTNRVSKTGARPRVSYSDMYRRKVS